MRLIPNDEWRMTNELASCFHGNFEIRFGIRHSYFENARVTTADAEQTTVAAFRPWRGS